MHYLPYSSPFRSVIIAHKVRFQRSWKYYYDLDFKSLFILSISLSMSDGDNMWHNMNGGQNIIQPEEYIIVTHCAKLCSKSEFVNQNFTKQATKYVKQLFWKMNSCQILVLWALLHPSMSSADFGVQFDLMKTVNWEDLNTIPFVEFLPFYPFSVHIWIWKWFISKLVCYLPSPLVKIFFWVL